MADLPPKTPPSIRRLLRRCLERNPRNRLHDIADARLVLEDVAAGVDDFEPEREPGRPSRRARAFGAWILAAGLAVALAVVLGRGGPEVPPPRVVRSTLPLPEGLSFELDGDRAGMPALSPDGKRIAFGGREGRNPMAIWVLELATGNARRLEGTEGGSRPFWSPDGREIGFFTWYALYRISAEGGPLTRLAPCRDARGGSWSADGTIIYAPLSHGPIFAVSAEGGVPRQVTGEEGEVKGTHRFPHFLPDGKHFLYLDRRELLRRPAFGGEGRGHVALGELGSRESRRLIELPTNASYADGHLLYVRDGTLVAQPFDPNLLKITGPARPLVADLLFNRRFTYGIFSASETGVLSFLTGRHSELSQLVWRNRRGDRLGELGSPGVLSGAGSPAVSPDGSWAATPRVDPATGDSDLWLYDLHRGTETRLARSEEDQFDPVFSLDSRSLYFASGSASEGAWSLHRRDLASGEEETLLTEEFYIAPASLSPNGQSLLLTRLRLEKNSSDLLLWSFDEEEPRTLLGGPHDEGTGQISPDGRWLAWTSDETGRHEVYVGAFPDLGSRVQITREGGRQPRWAPDGSELFFLDAANWLNAVPLQSGTGAVSLATPERLFQISEFWTWAYAVAPDGERFLVREPLEENGASPLTLLTDWTSLLEEE